MALTQEDASVLAQQLQDAHRYAAGFYHRFLPVMNTAVSTHGFEPYAWGSARFDNPPTRRPNPEGKWVWDLLPMCYTSFSYIRLDNSQTLLDIWFMPDPGLECEGFPDPFKMAKEDPSITIDVYTSNNVVDGDTDIRALVKSMGINVPEENDRLIEYTSGLIGARKDFLLADFMMEPEKAIAETLKIIGRAGN